MATQQLMFDILAKTAGVDKAFDGVVESAGSMANKLGGEGAKASKALFGPLLAAAGGGSIVAAFSKGIGDAIDMDSATRKMTAGLGLAGPASATAGQAAGNLFKNAYGDSMEGVTEAVSAVMSSVRGMSNSSESDLESLTGKVMNLSSAFDLDVGRTAQIAGQMIKSGLAKDGTEAADLLAGSLQRVPVNLREDLLDAVDEYGPFMDSLGIKGSDAMGMLVNASDKGMFGIDKTGDALKEFTIRATDMSTSSGAAYKALGMNQEEMTKKILAGGPAAKEAFAQIVGGLSSMTDPAKQSQAALALFGTPLEDLGTAQIPAFLNQIDPMGDAFDTMEGKADKLGETINSGPAASFKTFQRTAESTLGSIGAQVLPILTPILANLAQFAPVIGPAVIALGALAAVIAVVNFVMALNPITWIIVGIVALIAAIVALVMNWDSVVQFLTAVWNGFVGWLTDVMNGFVGWWNGIWDGFFGWTKDLWSGFVNWLSGLWNGFTSWLAGILDGFVGMVTGVWNNILGFLTGIWNAIAAATMAGIHLFVDPIFNGIMGVWNFIASIFTAIGNFIGGAWNWIVNLVRNIIIAFVKTHGDQIAEIWNNIVAVFTAIGNFFAGIWNTYVSIITAALQTVWGFVSSIFSAVWGFIVQVFTTVAGFLVDVWNNIVAVISGAVGAVWGVIVSAFSAAWGFIVGVFSAVAGFVGEVWGSIVAVISGAVGAVWGAIVSAFSAAWGFIVGVFSQVAGFLGGIWGNIVSGVSGMVGNVLNVLAGLGSQLLGALAGAGSWLYDIGRNIVEGLLSGIGSIAGSIGDFFLRLIPGWIVGPFKEALGIHSPSTVFAGFGENIGEGVLVGVGRMQDRIDDRMSSLVTVPDLSVTDAFIGTTGSRGGGGGQSVGDKLDALIELLRSQRPVQVHPAAGMDEETLGRATAEQLVWKG